MRVPSWMAKSLTVYQALLDALGHERRTTYQYQNDSWQRQSEEICRCLFAERALLPPDKMAEAFAQAVLYRNQEENAVVLGSRMGIRALLG